jgi:hypothetical protein
MSDNVRRRINLSQKRSKALRFLLLRYLRKYKSKVTEEVFLEVSHSLTVSSEIDSFIINWKRDSKSFHIEIPEHGFSFYRQGVVSNDIKQLPYGKAKNNRLAQQFALDALGIKTHQGTGEVPNNVSIEPYSSITFISNWIVCFILLWAVGVEHWPVVMLLGVIMSLEYLKWKGKLLSALIFAAFPFLGFPWIALIGGGTYSLLQFLDPNSYYRNLRVFTPLVGGFAGFMFVIHSYGTSGVEYRIVPLSIICIFVAVFRTTLLSHFRSMPLVFPFLGPAFYLNGFSTVGWCVAGLSFIGLIAIRSNLFQAIHGLFKHG